MTDQAKRFEAEVGTWDGEIEVRPQPGAEPLRSKGVMTNRMVGPWLVSDFRNDTGFEGRGIYGWDTAKQAYVGTWIDDARGSLVIGRGTVEGATLTYAFELVQGATTTRWYDSTEILDDNTRRFRTSYILPGGEHHHVVTALYRRR